MAGSMETKLHEMEVHEHAHAGDVISGVAIPAVNAGSRMAELYQAFTDFSAGALGGALSMVVGQPFDTVKVKLQTYPNLYPSAIQCFRQTMKAEGVPGLFKGMVPAIAAAVGEMSVIFMCYGQCQKFVCRVSGIDSISDLTPFQNAQAGFVAAFFSSFVLCPTELVKCRLQAMTELTSISKDLARKIGPWQVTKDVFKKEGPQALFQGLTSTWLREMPGFFFFFGGYEASKILLTPKGKTKEDLGPLRIMASGGIAGAIAWTCTFPIDVIKTRIQTQSPVAQSVTGLRNPLPVVCYSVPTQLCLAQCNPTRMTCVVSRREVVVRSNALLRVVRPMRIMACGGKAGGCQWASIYPIDVIKSRIQVQSLVGPMPGFLSTAVHTYRTEGARAFVRGMGPCVLRAFPVNATLFITYEFIRKQMMLHRPEIFD